MASQPIYLTREGYKKIKEEHEYLSNTKRREISRAIGIARAHGDLKENAEYHAAKEEQGHIERRIAQLSNHLSHVRIIEDEKIPNDKVYIGSIVTLLDVNTDEEIQYTLLSEEEADIAKNRISTTSPIGRGLLGREPGDSVTIRVPSGVREYEILDISRL
jgi:transcription elongation factor GreA